MRISDWSSDVCSYDRHERAEAAHRADRDRADRGALEAALAVPAIDFTADQRADELADHAASRSPVARSQAAPNPRSTRQPIAQVATTGHATLRTFAATIGRAECRERARQ